jgi:hypothetical protein
MAYKYNISYNFTKYIVKRKEILRPIIPVELQYRDNDPIIYTMLLDSGADIPLLSKDVGESLGINTERKPDDDVYGVTGHTPVIDETIKIKFGMGNRYEFESEIPMQITKIHGRPALPTLGRETIFKEFDIHFRMGQAERKRKFVLSKL